MKIFRVIVPVSDLETAVSFYARLLDMPGRAVRGGRHYFDCGPVILALLDNKLLDNKKPPISDYLYLAVAGLEAVHARAADLGCLSKESVHGASAGEMIVRPWGERCFYVYDPFGNGLCFVEEGTEFRAR
jgi:catechol 2,3-dioxygenase-like lactoylglutathione lyase family enzyme